MEKGIQSSGHDHRKPSRSTKRLEVQQKGEGEKDEQVFDLFPELPVDLRRLIWKEASSQQRNVDIHIQTVGFIVPADQIFYADTSRRVEVFSFHSCCRPPAVLHTNRESRDVALESYVLDFGMSCSHPTYQYTFTASPTIYINWKVDRVCLLGPIIPHHRRCNDYLEKLFHEKELKYLAIETLHSNMPLGQRNWELCPPGIVELIVFHRDRTRFRGGVIQFRAPEEKVMTVGFTEYITDVQQVIVEKYKRQLGSEEKIEVKLMSIWIDGQDRSCEPSSYLTTS